METNKVLLHGAGEHGKVVAACLLDEGREVIGMFDPRFDGEWNGIRYLGKYQPALFRQTPIILSIGNNNTRKELAGATAHTFTGARHATAYVSRYASIGNGSMILQGVIVQEGTSIGDHVILNTACRVDHDCAISSFVHIAPGVILNGCVRVGEGAFIGAGAILIPGITVGPWATVGAGTVVIRDVPAGSVVVGNPGRLIKDRNA